MKKSLSPYLVLTISLAAIILTLFLTTKTENGCDTVDTVLTSVKVNTSNGLKYIGFDINKQNLNFGVLSPGATAKKTAFTEYTKNATTYVWAEGNLSSWVIISPKKFGIEPKQKKEVTFTLLVPATAKAGDYNGRIVFCYQDR